jgi:hypothetical protein
MDNQKNSKDTQAAALLASVTIAAGFILYWVIQIQAVREMLALAYGN